MEQNKIYSLFIVRRLKPTVNQVLSLQENWNKLQTVCMLTAAKSCRDDCHAELVAGQARNDFQSTERK